jgi:hypothetical protein
LDLVALNLPVAADSNTADVRQCLGLFDTCPCDASTLRMAPV